MFKHSFFKRVRYGETDQMGFLYYGNYALLYEIGRVEAIRSLGVVYKDIEDKLGIMMPVVAMECRYRKPALYDQLVRIDTILETMPSKMIEFKYEIYNPDDELLHSAAVKLFFLEMKTNRRVSAPEILTSKIKSYFD